MIRFQKLQSKRRVDVVTSHLRKAIVDGRAKAGEYLPPEREMAKQFGVARLVIREALRALESSGFVEIKRGVKGGCLVRESSPTHLSRSFTNMLNRGRITLRHLLEFRLG